MKSVDTKYGLKEHSLSSFIYSTQRQERERERLNIDVVQPRHTQGHKLLVIYDTLSLVENVFVLLQFASKRCGLFGHVCWASSMNEFVNKLTGQKGEHSICTCRGAVFATPSIAGCGTPLSKNVGNTLQKAGCGNAVFPERASILQ